MKRLQLSSVGLLLSLFLCCSGPFDRSTLQESGTGILIVRTGADVRTVMHDFSADVDTVEIELTSQEGYDSLNGTVTLPQSTYTFDSVQEGVWDISITARSQGAAIGGGSLPNQTILSGKVSSITILLSFPPGSGSGSLSLVVQFPADIGIDYVQGIIGTAVLVPPLTTVDGESQVKLEVEALPAGYGQNLQITFRRGGATGTIAGYSIEAVNIWSGLTSDKWVDANGQLVSVRTYTASDFFDDSSTLSHLQLSAGTIAFDPNTLSYDAGCVLDHLSITPIEAAAGQQIQYRLNGGNWSGIASGETSAPLPLTLETNILEVNVTAPDHETERTYAITVHKGYTVTYDGNGSGSGSVPQDALLYPEGESVTVLHPEELSAGGYSFYGWNSSANGSGTAYAPGQTFEMGISSVTLYAQWQVLSPSFSLQSGVYTSAQTVNISCATAGATIRYTADGSDPSPMNGTIGTSVAVSSSMTLKAIAYEADHPLSVIAQADYTITSVVTVGFTLMYPGAQVISFSSTAVSVPRGQTLMLSTTNATLSALPDWKWYVNLTQVPGQTTSTFSWDTTGQQPGQYNINVTVVYEGVNYSGSLRVTVTY